MMKVLQETLIGDYLQAFSPKVCQLLDVKSLEEEREYLEQQIIKVEQASTFFYCIFEQVSDLLIGAIEIRSIAYRSQLYNWINEQFWGNGYYQEAMQAAIPEYFVQFPQETEFNALVDVSNLRSYYGLKKLGFVDVGLVNGPREKQYNLIVSKFTF